MSTALRTRSLSFALSLYRQLRLLLPWKSVCWGWFKTKLSEITAARRFLDMIVKAITGKRAVDRMNRIEIEKFFDSSAK